MEAHRELMGEPKELATPFACARSPEMFGVGTGSMICGAISASVVAHSVTL